MIKEILLAEDDRGSGFLIKTLLERNGYRVSLVRNGVEALRIIEQRPIDLVITDVVMPEMDGVDLYLELKKNSQTKNLPIIIITDKQVFIDSFSALGVDHFVPKSSDMGDLLAKVRSVDALSGEDKNYVKVILGGGKAHILREMQEVLRERGFLVSSAEKWSDVSSQALMMTPHLILLDVFFHPGITTGELIRSLRCYDVLRPAKVWVYNSLSPDDMIGGLGALYSLEFEVKACFEAGAQEYIGRYNKVSFAAQIRDLQPSYFYPFAEISK